MKKTDRDPWKKTGPDWFRVGRGATCFVVGAVLFWFLGMFAGRQAILPFGLLIFGAYESIRELLGEPGTW